MSPSVRLCVMSLRFSLSLPHSPLLALSSHSFDGVNESNNALTFPRWPPTEKWPQLDCMENWGDTHTHTHTHTHIYIYIYIYWKREGGVGERNVRIQILAISVNFIQSDFPIFLQSTPSIIYLSVICPSVIYLSVVYISVILTSVICPLVICPTFMHYSSCSC